MLGRERRRRGGRYWRLPGGRRCWLDVWRGRPPLGIWRRRPCERIVLGRERRRRLRGLLLRRWGIWLPIGRNRLRKRVSRSWMRRSLAVWDCLLRLLVPV